MLTKCGLRHWKGLEDNMYRWRWDGVRRVQARPEHPNDLSQMKVKYILLNRYEQTDVVEKTHSSIQVRGETETH